MAIKGGSNVAIRIKLPLSVLARIRQLQPLGRYKDHYENEFVSYLIELGLQRYERVVLHIEQGEDIVLRTAPVREPVEDTLQRNLAAGSKM